MKSKISTIIVLAIIMIFLIQLNVQAVVISSDKQVESGSGTVTVSVTSNQTLGAYTLKLTDSAGLTLTGATGQYVSSDFKTVTGSSAEGTKSLGTFTFKVPTVDKDTKYNIKFSITGMETPDLEQVANETNTAVITVKAKKVQTQQPSTEQEKPTTTTPSTPTTEKPTVEEKPNFTEANKKMYAKNDINLRATWSTSSKATKIEKGTELTVTATSKNKVNNYVWYRVSYNGETKYVAGNLLSTTKPVEEKPVEEPKKETPEEATTTADNPKENAETTKEIKGLKTLEIEGLTLSPKFETDIYKYEAVLRKNISELKVNAETLEEDGAIVVAGNTNIQEGENLITIIVYNAKGEAKATYQIVVNKNTLDLTTTDELLKYGNQAATLKTTIYMIAILFATILLITVLIIRYKTQNKSEETEVEPQKAKEEKQEKFAIEEEKKGKHF